jgi:hypothetical protein
MEKKEINSIGLYYYLSIRQVASLEHCSVQNIYSHLKKHNSVFYVNGNCYFIKRFGEVKLFSPAETNRYLIDRKLITLDEWFSL